MTNSAKKDFMWVFWQRFRAPLAVEDREVFQGLRGRAILDGVGSEGWPISHLCERCAACLPGLWRVPGEFCIILLQLFFAFYFRNEKPFVQVSWREAESAGNARGQ